ncbi:Metallo-hydrolase/oxidoreductase [Basidiobolus meristosporus CBS 931.73]|uniref:ribonuclease Z n=1 Tax=Basidiobolus meristosporus CBS 931.73 TaxID=1314790 RepID=A0A1Y1YI54_9FUNG|nr:Metallo-hydrolase/oxidoreductase [Basidiobolus meristosporus CBS 931.73]|eukprot:ORX97727.1 Metallo-hydrolase/oxidoreductase [Basidiobolus meristosporus CBS 931.73]
MKSYIQIIGTSGVDVTPSVVVHFDSQRYLFNCGEGTQRLCVEKKVRLAKLQNIFFTRINWENTGGIPGMMLTLADAGTTKLTLHGGPNLTHFIAATRHFIQRSSLKLGLNESMEPYKDENLTMTTVQLTPDYQPNRGTPINIASIDRSRKRKPTTETDTAREAEDAESIRQTVLKKMFGEKNIDISMCKQAQLEVQKESVSKKPKVTNPTNERKIYERLPRVERSRIALCYICQGPTIQGKFDPKAAAELGVQRGPDFGKLKNGQSVTTSSGVVVKPEQVVGPSRPGTNFIIVDCPSTAYIPSLVNSPEFEQFLGSGRSLNIHCAIHLVGDDVLENKQYQKWMKKFGSGCQHIVAHPKYCAQTITFSGSAKAQMKLSHIDSEIFPIPYFSNVAEKQLSSIPDLPKRCVEASSLLVYHTEPTQKLDTSGVLPPLNPSAKELKPFLNRRQDYVNAVKKLQIDRTQPSKEDVVIATLGTGSSLPSKYRNVSSTAIIIPHVGSILLDAGEGTYGQLYRHLGVNKSHNQMINQSVDDFLRSLKFIFVSHLHADHHLGVIRILDKWNELQPSTHKQPLYIVAPLRFQTWLHEYSDVQEIGLGSIRFINAEELVYHKKRNYTPYHLKDLKQALNLKEIKTTDVIHCPWAYGISLEHTEGWKLVYSGDTRPCDKLVHLGKDATLLIHEATFEHEKKQEAIEKRHSTVTEAIDVSARMNSSFLLLTHFSQRYPQVPVFTDSHAKVGISFDLMNVRISELSKLSKFVQPLKVLYRNSSGEMDSDEEESL